MIHACYKRPRLLHGHNSARCRLKCSPRVGLGAVWREASCQGDEAVFKFFFFFFFLPVPLVPSGLSRQSEGGKRAHSGIATGQGCSEGCFKGFMLVSSKWPFLPITPNQDLFPCCIRMWNGFVCLSTYLSIR